DMSDPYKPVQTWSCCRGEACLARPSLEHSRPVEDHIDRSAWTKTHLVPMAGYGGYHDCGRANREPNACACLSSRDCSSHGQGERRYARMPSDFRPSYRPSLEFDRGRLGRNSKDF